MGQTNKHHVTTDVTTAYIEAQSSPEGNRYVFTYTITIHNHGTAAARLLNRHWLITDANGKTQEVRGSGVIGKQPYLSPGEVYEYTSGTAIETPVGSMEGEYEMVDNDGFLFLTHIAPFSLSVPHLVH